MLIVSALLPASLRAQDAEPAEDPAVLYVLTGEHHWSTLGTEFVPLGDIDGDGMADFSVTALEDHSGVDGLPSTGVVKVVSGKEGRVLRQFRGFRPHHYFGFHLTPVGDLDGDGRLELGITGDGGELYIYSPVSGELLWKGDFFGDDLSRGSQGQVTRMRFQFVPNLQGDGRPGIVIGDPYFGSVHVKMFPGRMIAVRLEDSARIWWRAGDWPGGFLAASLLTVSDLDGDGTPELCTREKNEKGGYVIGVYRGRTGERMRRVGDGRRMTPREPFVRLGDLNGDGITEIGYAALDSTLIGAAVVLDGRSFEEIYHYEGHDRIQVIAGFDGDNLGEAFSSVGDIDLDGVPDFVVVATRPSGPLLTTFSRLFLRSGKTGRLLQVYEALNGDEPLAWEVSPLGDVTGDGRPEFLVGSPFNGPSPQTGEVRVLRYEPEILPTFLRGDANLDGQVDISDAVEILWFIMSEQESAPCLRALDASSGGIIDFEDAIFLLKYVFDGRIMLPPPFPECARFHRVDEVRPLPCERSTCEPD